MFRAEDITLASGRTQTVHRAGQGPPLVWLHGLFGFDPADPLVQALAERHELIAPTSPGFEDVGELSDLDDVHDLAQHYDDILLALDLDRVPLVGHSFGAMVAAELAARRPQAVERLVLLAPLGLWNDEHPVGDLFALPYPDMPGLLYADPSRARGAGADTDVEGDVERLVTLAQAMTTVAKFLWPIPDRRLRSRLYRITPPALVLFGERDAFVPASYADEFVEGMPAATSAIVPGAGHMLQHERPGEVIAAVTEFLGAGVPARAHASS